MAFPHLYYRWNRASVVTIQPFLTLDQLHFKDHIQINIRPSVQCYKQNIPDESDHMDGWMESDGWLDEKV